MARSLPPRWRYPESQGALWLLLVAYPVFSSHFGKQRAEKRQHLGLPRAPEAQLPDWPAALATTPFPSAGVTEPPPSPGLM